MKFRWVVYRNKVSSDMIRSYALENNIPMMEAKKFLVNEKSPILQYNNGDGVWCDIPTVIIEL